MLGRPPHCKPSSSTPRQGVHTGRFWGTRRLPSHPTGPGPRRDVLCDAALSPHNKVTAGLSCAGVGKKGGRGWERGCWGGNGRVGERLLGERGVLGEQGCKWEVGCWGEWGLQAESGVMGEQGEGVLGERGAGGKWGAGGKGGSEEEQGMLGGKGGAGEGVCRGEEGVLGGAGSRRDPTGFRGAPSHTPAAVRGAAPAPPCRGRREAGAPPEGRSQRRRAPPPLLGPYHWAPSRGGEGPRTRG